ncbi:MAG: hypothetical protein JSW07_14995 [bacterium]|nr:MAG: hypothetical protein JSW07_14995 [bacterium]
MRQIFFTIIFCSISVLLYGAIEIMPLKDVRPGMRGTGLTVFENNQIEQFDVEIIDIVRNFSPHRDLILVRLLGEKVNHTGVIIGMSGSPIYINNRLIGAIAYSMGNFMKDPIAGVTPIEQMLEIFNKEKVRNEEIISTAQQTSVHITDYFRAYRFEKFDIFNFLKFQQTSNFPGVEPIEIPLVVSGLSPSLYKKFSNQFINSNFILLPGGKSHQSTIKGGEKLKPGSAVAGIIIGGDFDISAIGTVTYRDEDKILAFGHSFFNSGPVNIPLAEAKVITTLSSLYASNKFAVATEIIGNIRQDRSTGILGIIGVIPPMIPINVKVSSPIIAEKKFQFNIANDRSMAGIMPVFLWITLLNALESARLGAGDYALKLKGQIDLEKYPAVILDNFYSGGSAGFFDGSGMDIPEAAFDIVMTLASLLVNDFEIPKIRGVDLEFFAQPGQKLAVIESVFYDKEEVSPGDSLNIIIFLRPYQGKRIELNKRIYIPKNIASDMITLAVGGAEEIKNWDYQAGIGRFTPSNFKELVTLLNRKRKNTDIIIQLKVADSGAVLHGQEFPTLPPSIYEIMKDKKTHKIYDSVTEKIVKEWSIALAFEIRGGRKFSLVVKHH